MGFLDKVGEFGSAMLKAANEQMSIGENTPKGISTGTFDPEKMTDYGTLGDFANKVDQTAQRSYTESGYIGNVKPQSFEILMQEPDITVVIKKKMFSSLIDNYKIELMDVAERNFIKASKRLFQNKCQAISVYERLSKLDKIIQNKGVIDDYLVPLLQSGIDSLEAIGINIVDAKTKAALQQIRKLQSFSEPSIYTNWITDPNTSTIFGEGTGVFEITLVSSLSTSSSVNYGQGTATLTIEDPYHLLSINESDIDKAIADVFNPKQTSLLFQFSEDELTKQTARLFQELNSSRIARNIPQITIRVNESSVLNKKVRAFIDDKEVLFEYNPGFFGINGEVNIDPGTSTDFEPIIGLNEGDSNLLSLVLANTYKVLALKKQKDKDLSDVENEDNREDIAHVREKMGLYLLNKNIIQSMDVVHIFMSSKTKVDPKIPGMVTSSIYGSGNNILTKLNSAITNVENAFEDLKSSFGGASDNNFVEVEKDAIVGPDFPTWLWVSMRNDFTRQAAGTHVFAGPVDTVKESFSDGSYTLSVSINDNTAYFKMGQINTKPAVDTIDREIYDPLTPYSLDFDASSGFMIGECPSLLPENEKLLANGSVKFKNGSRFLGSSVSKITYGIGDIQPNNGTTLQKVFYDPDGFIYRWKSGIGTFTFQGPRHPKNAIREQAAVSISSNIFAGQDVMNVLSLLITGQPYNYNTFITSAIKSANLSFENNGVPNNQNLLNVDVSTSFFKSYMSDLQTNNLLWGGFIPFKKLIVSERGTNLLIQGQFAIQQSNASIKNLIDQRARTFDALVAKDGAYANSPDMFGIDARNDLTAGGSLPGEGSAIDQIRLFDAKISQQQEEIQRSIANANLSNAGQGAIRIFGDDMSYDPTYSDIGNVNSPEESDRQRAQLRNKLKFLTQRRLWKVKANEDQNLLIVDDQYDKDYDIQAFEQKLAGQMANFKSEYTNSSEQIDIVRQLLGLEVFADTQGHIQIKPPGFNRVPSSVFYRMVASNKRLFPKQLESLFINQAEGLIDRLEILEDEIRLRTSILGAITDKDSEKVLNSSKVSSSGSFTFKFVTDEQGKFGGYAYNIRKLVQQNNPEKRENIESKSLKKDLGKISGQVRQQGLFDISAQITNVYSNNQVTPNMEETFSVIQQRLQRRTNTKIKSFQDIVSNTRSGPKYRSQTDTLKLVNEISAFVSERQGVLKTLANAIRSIDEGLSINSDPKSAKTALFPNLNKRNPIPSIIEHMIENEEEDDYGPGSGQRYIIKDYQIISMEISETPPKFTTVEVNGMYGDGWVDPAAGLEIGTGGNAQVSAIAVDYDLWRQYGFKITQSVPIKAISDADSQAAPFAVWLLNQQRRTVLGGSVTIVGNEFMQPGEVVYLECRDLLFYVETVNHTFTYGSNFQTTLTLTYGHNPGEYFPTMLDIIGKGLYSKRNQSNLIRNVRNGNAGGFEHLGVITINTSGSSSGLAESIAGFFAGNALPIDQLVSGTYGDYNVKVLTNMLITLKGSEVEGTGVEPVIEIRQYFNTKKGYAQNENLRSVASGIISWLANPTKKTDESMLPVHLAEGLKISTLTDNIKVVPIDYTDSSSPSRQAWLMAREAVQGVSQRQASSQASELAYANAMGKQSNRVSEEENNLFSSILDIWVTFKTKKKTLEKSNLTSQQTMSNNELINYYEDKKNS